MTKASSVDIETTRTIPRDTIRRKTSRHLQQHNAEKRNLKKRVDGAFITATRRWREEKTKDKNERNTARSIVDEINNVHGTSLNDRTVRLYANRGDADSPITGRGKKTILRESVELALSSSMLSYIHLAYSGMNQMPYRKHLIQKMKLCLNGSAYTYKRCDHLYDCIMRKIADKVDVSGDDYNMEQSCFIWNMYRSINIWFETLKHF